MKKETKELLEYIILQFSTRKNTRKEMSAQDMVDAIGFNERNQKIQNFLRAIPKIEEKLCFGGYIQDRDGVPCCHGDKIMLPTLGFAGILQWNSASRCFYVTDNNGYYEPLGIFDFEKVEECLE